MANTIKKSHLSKEHDASSKNASVAKVTGRIAWEHEYAGRAEPKPSASTSNLLYRSYRDRVPGDGRSHHFRRYCSAGTQVVSDRSISSMGALAECG